ncbi:MAG: stalk domain-containing protein [Peptococcaceae bacterium]|nr:stalk domain-containing protein [Peptococcaceae bacterium]
MKKYLSFFLLLLLATSLAAPPAQAAEANQYASRVYVQVDTALADGSDEAELNVLLLDLNFTWLKDQKVYCATDNSSDSINVGANDEGWVEIRISSGTAGTRHCAVSLISKDAAAAFLAGEMTANEAKILQSDGGLERIPLNFISGRLDPDFCMIEFDKDYLVVTGGDYSDFSTGTISLRTETDQPAGKKYVTLSTTMKGVTITPSAVTTNALGEATFRVSSTQLGDAEIIATADGETFSEFVTFDTPENVYAEYYEELESLYEEDEDEEEEEELIISVENTRTAINKPLAQSYGKNDYYGLSTKEEDRDRIIVSGIAMTVDEEPVKGQHLVNAYATAGQLDKNTVLTTSTGGAFSFTLTSKDECLGRIAVGLGTPEQLKGYLEGKVSAEACRLIGEHIYGFGGYKWGNYLLCAVGKTTAAINGVYRTLDVAPFITDGRTMLTVRPAAEALKADTKWDKASQTITITLEDKTRLSMKVGSKTMTREKSGRSPETLTTDVPAALKSGRTVLPLRNVANAFDLQTLYDSGQRLVCIYSLKS